MLLGWLIRLLLAVLVIRVAWHFVSGFVTGMRGQARRSAEGSVALVKDPVCGTYIRRVDALSARAGARTHYFCSERCQQAFLKTA
ncbi:MAG TPA: YHS domain-containing protein [Acidobacteria bacterium]|jgi:YHS domain-containing protein|nr:YHS domain-containing protein [Acidobacteriota bacterium]